MGFEHRIDHRAEDLGRGGFVVTTQGRFAGIAGGDNRRIERNRAEERDVHLFGQRFATFALEEVDPFATLGTDKTAHVFEDAHHGQGNFVAKRDAASDIGDGDLLWSGDKDRLGTASNELRDGKRLVAGSGRGVDDQIVEWSPKHVLEKLLDNSKLRGPRQMTGSLFEGSRKPIDMTDRLSLTFTGMISSPTSPTCWPLSPKSPGDARTMDVDIQQPDFLA